ncbi:hypothetical protein HGI09_49770 [Streptomyces collinus]|nr:hypothetical protein HGI10_14330 [Streptomyces collinus]UJA17601.1 hypothetical protein HGI09_49770 [Streptomyces collinus]
MTDREDAARRAELGPHDGARGRRAHVSLTGLRARGWSAGLVRRLLGEPDLLRVNRYSVSAPPTRLYRLERVEAAEESPGFRVVAAATVRRSGTASAGLRRGRREVSARAAAAARGEAARSGAERQDPDEAGP